MSSITLIIPILKGGEHLTEDFTKLKDSIEKVRDTTDLVSEVILTGPQSVIDSIEVDDTYTKCFTDSYNYGEVVNNAVMNVSTEYFSVLEPNDTLSEKWALNFNLYKESNTKADIYLYLGTARKSDDNEFISFLNEISWSSGFADVHGVVTEGCLNAYFIFKATCGIFNTEDFISLGKLKRALGVATWYEYLLRACKANKRIYVIPKNGFTHFIHYGEDNAYSGGASIDDINNENSWLFASSQKNAESAEEIPLDKK